jgi:DNA/RNA-binding domain of Phe-tRNA-synthetase-like protein
MFDAEKLGVPAKVRFGRSGESYVFNTSGQTMNLEGIPVVCRTPDDVPIGNAVKDSMLAKVGASTQEVVAVVYGSNQLAQDTLSAAAQELVGLLREFAAAEKCETKLLPS